MNIFETSLTGTAEVARFHDELKIDRSLHKQILGTVFMSMNVAINAEHLLIRGTIPAINLTTQVPRSTVKNSCVI